MATTLSTWPPKVRRSPARSITTPSARSPFTRVPLVDPEILQPHLTAGQGDPGVVAAHLPIQQGHLHIRRPADEGGPGAQGEIRPGGPRVGHQGPFRRGDGLVVSRQEPRDRRHVRGHGCLRGEARQDVCASWILQEVLSCCPEDYIPTAGTTSCLLPNIWYIGFSTRWGVV